MIVRALAFVFALGTMGLLVGCVPGECKDALAQVEALCGSQSEALTELAGRSEQSAENCRQSGQALAAATGAAWEAEFHSVGKDALCAALVEPASDAFDISLETASYRYSSAAHSAAKAVLESSLEQRNFDRAEALWPQIQSFGDDVSLDNASYDIGWAFLNPSVELSKATVTEDTRWRSSSTWGRHPDGHCSGRHGHLVDGTPDYEKARSYFERVSAVERRDQWLRLLAYRMGDLEAFDSLKPASGAPAAAFSDAVARVQLLVAADRHSEALAEAKAGLETANPKDTRSCELGLVVGRLHERAMRYEEARAAYRKMNGCNHSAQARLEALERSEVADGQPLPTVSVSGWVDAPAGTETIHVFLTSYFYVLPESPFTTLAGPDASPHENFSHSVSIEATMTESTFRAEVPAGTWALTVVTTGSKPLEWADCPPRITVEDPDIVDQDIELSTIELAVDTTP